MNHAAEFSVARAERIFAIALIIYSTSAFVRFFIPEGSATGAAGVLLQILWCFFYGVAGTVLVTRQGFGRALAALDRWLLAVVGLSLLSIVWSQAPFVTAQRSFGLLGTVVCGLYLRARFSLRELLRLVALAVFVIGTVTILLAVALPSEVHDPLYTSAWRGPFLQKNNLGRVMAVGILAALLGKFRGSQAARAGLMSIVLLVLLKSDSKTAALGLVLALGVAGIARWLRRPDRQLTAVGTVFIALSVSIPTFFLIGGPLGALEGVGRDSTITGRAQLWSEVWSAIHHHLLAGAGFGAFWRGAANQEVVGIWSRVGWEAPHAHNGFLDVWLELGVIGFGLLACLVVRRILQNLMQIVRGESGAAVRLVFFSFLLIMNLSESNLLRENTLMTLLLVAFSCSQLKSPWRSQGIVPDALSLVAVAK